MTFEINIFIRDDAGRLTRTLVPAATETEVALVEALLAQAADMGLEVRRFRQVPAGGSDGSPPGPREVGLAPFPQDAVDAEAE